MLTFALENLRDELAVDMDFDPVADWGMCGNSDDALFAFVHATRQQRHGDAEETRRASWNAPGRTLRRKNVSTSCGRCCSPRQSEPRKLQADQEPGCRIRIAVARDMLHARLQAVRDTLAEQQAYRLNEAVLHCGVAFLERYQALKAQKQQMDFSDLEWQLCRLLQQSEHAETMQYKLDSRYRHVLLDEFQDTNPLQWQILRAWFDASVAVESQPTVFVVGDPKQSIYRFRRADARLFGVAREYLKEHFAAHELHNNHTRRNAPAVLDAVNAVFADHPEGFVDFEPHTAEHTGLARPCDGVAACAPSPRRRGKEEAAEDAPLDLARSADHAARRSRRGRTPEGSRAIRRPAANHRQRLVGERRRQSTPRHLRRHHGAGAQPHPSCECTKKPCAQNTFPSSARAAAACSTRWKRKTCRRC